MTAKIYQFPHQEDPGFDGGDGKGPDHIVEVRFILWDGDDDYEDEEDEEDEDDNYEPTPRTTFLTGFAFGMLLGWMI